MGDIIWKGKEKENPTHRVKDSVLNINLAQYWSIFKSLWSTLADLSLY